jgi:prophage maintenance system killer protein
LSKKNKGKRTWRKTNTIVATLDFETVVAIHEQLTAEFSITEDPISPSGVRDNGLLESAVFRQLTSVGEVMKYDSPAKNAAALMFGVCNNHPFYNGNKRAALVAGLLHLDRNNLVLHNVDKDDLFRLMKRVASHFYSTQKQGKDILSSPDEEIAAIANWIEENSREIVRGERSIPYAEFYRIIQQFDYKLGEKRNNQIEILQKKKRWFLGEKWVCVYKVACPGDSRIVPIDQIKAVRRVLSLTENDGIDSESFYDSRLVIDSFITSHRQVLRKLAKT